MYNRHEVIPDENGEGHYENFTFSREHPFGAEVVTEHENCGSDVNGDSKIDDGVHLIFPFRFSGYIIPYLAVKGQRILGKICVKFAAG